MLNGQHYDRRYRSRLQPFSGWPNAIALVDILLLLLMFLFISTPFVQLSGIEVRLPKIGTGTRMGLERFIVTISCKNGFCQLYFNDRPMTLETLPEALSAVSSQTDRSSNPAIIIRADADAPHELVTAVMAAAARSHLATFLATGEAVEAAGGVKPPTGER